MKNSYSMFQNLKNWLFFQLLTDCGINSRFPKIRKTIKYIRITILTLNKTLRRDKITVLTIDIGAFIIIRRQVINSGPWNSSTLTSMSRKNEWRRRCTSGCSSIQNYKIKYNYMLRNLLNTFRVSLKVEIFFTEEPDFLNTVVSKWKKPPLMGLTLAYSTNVFISDGMEGFNISNSQLSTTTENNSIKLFKII